MPSPGNSSATSASSRWGWRTATTPLPTDEPAFGFSTDVAMSAGVRPPWDAVMPTVPLEVGLHTWAATACHGTSIGLKGALYPPPVCWPPLA